MVLINNILPFTLGGKMLTCEAHGPSSIPDQRTWLATILSGKQSTRQITLLACLLLGS